VKTWLITGSSRRFGWELAKAVLESGDNAVATARRPEQLGDLVAEYGERVRTVALDVTDVAAARAAVKMAVDEFGRLDVVVNNAGYAESQSIEDTAEEDFRAQLETNLFGVVNVTKAALPVVPRRPPSANGRGTLLAPPRSSPISSASTSRRSACCWERPPSSRPSGHQRLAPPKPSSGPT
jgi:NAD(P)-dependent dehydrogenase (short-subunit alcohol dehydrogenase family)